VDIYTSLHFADENGSLLFHIGAPYTLPNADTFDIVLNENGTADLSLKEDALARIKRTLPLENMDGLTVYARYLKIRGWKYEPHCYPREERPKNIFIEPWKASREEIEHFAGCSIEKFWRYVERFKHKEHMLSYKGLHLVTKVLLYRIHMRHNYAFKSLASMFFLPSESTTNKIFWEIATLDYATGLRIPRFWTSPAAAATENDEEKCQIFEEIWEMGTPFSKRLSSYFKDPTGRNRKPVVFNIDSMKLQIQKSSDFHFQKRSYANYKSSNFILYSDDTPSIIIMLSQVTILLPQS
jgi:hypothetical protein